ncbi:MAG: dihydrofolate reductase FolA [Parcubacteria group bacterium Gr01-1014_72]|nr:MAG: dihydrofolate reductase FolA [Parcubacteria group bacterium Gr01-1014_72]
MKVFIIAVQTVDGFIARKESEPSFAWTSGADKKNFVERTKKAGVVIMGRKTFETIGKPLKDRLVVVYSHKPLSKQFEGVEQTDKAPRELLQELAGRGYSEVAVCGGASIYSLFLKERVVDTLYLTLEPRLFGTGIKLLSEPFDGSLQLASSTKLAASVLLLEYTITYGSSHEK